MTGTICFGTLAAGDATSSCTATAQLQGLQTLYAPAGPGTLACDQARLVFACLSQCRLHVLSIESRSFQPWPAARVRPGTPRASPVFSSRSVAGFGDAERHRRLGYPRVRPGFHFTYVMVDGSAACMLVTLHWVWSVSTCEQ